MTWIDTVAANLTVLARPLPQVVRRLREEARPPSPKVRCDSYERLAQLVPDWGRLENRSFKRRG